MFGQNTGTLDRDLRLGLAAFCGLLTLFAPLSGLWPLVPAIFGIVMLVTAATGICPLYMLFGINTCGVATKPTTTEP